MKPRVLIIIAAIFLGSLALQMLLARKAQSKPQVKPKTSKTAKTRKTMSITDFKLQSLDGKIIDFSQYKGKTLLIVNTASKCGYTKQYAGLQSLNEKYHQQGLAILGFPANNFGAQEPGTNQEIGAFCQKNYGVSFQMFAKLSVKGDDQAPLFNYLTTGANPDLTGDIAWNFEKFLISRDGKLVARFKSNVAPDSAELLKALETELAKK